MFLSLAVFIFHNLSFQHCTFVLNKGLRVYKNKKMYDGAVYVMAGDGMNVGQMTTKKCSADKQHKIERDFTCPMGSQYCMDDAPQQCESKSPVFPWVEQSRAPIVPPHVSLEAEICLKVDDSICALKSQVCANDPEHQMCKVLGAVCKR